MLIDDENLLGCRAQCGGMVGAGTGDRFGVGISKLVSSPDVQGVPLCQNSEKNHS